MLAEVRISSASYEDLPEVARVDVEAWKEAYVCQIPQAYLDGLDVEQRLQRWREQYSNGARMDKPAITLISPQFGSLLLYYDIGEFAMRPSTLEANRHALWALPVRAWLFY